VPPHLLSEPGPSASQLETLLTLAARVPDHGKLVPWRFIVFSGEGRERAGAIVERVFLADNPQADAERRAQERGRFSRAPLVIGVVSRAAPHPKIPEWEQQLSAGAACMALSLAANGMGFGCSWLTEWHAFDRRVLSAFGLTPDERIAGYVHIGTPPASPPSDRPRPALADVVTHF
jgi:nitroreductase